MMKRFAVVLCLLLWSGACLHGAFIDGKETFDGTELDLDTWKIYDRSSTFSTITQDNDLTLSGNTYLTTRDTMVSIGDTVRVEITDVSCFETHQFHHSTLILCDRHPEDYTNMIWAGVEFGNSLNPESDYYCFNFLNKHGINTHTPMPLGLSSYVLQLTYKDEHTFEYSIYTPGEEPYFTVTRNAEYIPDNLYISLSSSHGGTVTFDNVEIVPEPATLSLLALGLIAVRRRRTKA